MSSITNVDVGDKVIAGGVPDDTIVSQKDYDRITLSNNVVVGAGGTSERVEFVDFQQAVVSLIKENGKGSLYKWDIHTTCFVKEKDLLYKAIFQSTQKAHIMIL